MTDFDPSGGGRIRFLAEMQKGEGMNPETLRLPVVADGQEECGHTVLQKMTDVTAGRVFYQCMQCGYVLDPDACAEAHATLRKRLEEAEEREQLWRVLASPAWIGDESEGYFQCLCCNQCGTPDGGAKTIVHLPDCKWAALRRLVGG